MDITTILGQLTFYITVSVSIIAIGFILRILYLRRQHSAMGIVTNTAFLIALAMYAITGLISLNYQKYRPDGIELVNEQTLFAITYAIYFLLWILANSYFLNQTARIPKDRLTQFKIVRFILNFEIALLVLLGLATLDIIPILQYEVFGLSRNDTIELVFVLLSQIALVTFTYFYRALGREQMNNASKMIKARIQLMKYAIAMQIGLSLTIGIAAGFLFANVLPDMIIEFSLFTIVSLISLGTNIIILSSINIPHFIRVRFNIAPKRFNFVVANNKKIHSN